jgi:MFS transporter, DHA2 family, multidrug resistance protein
MTWAPAALRRVGWARRSPALRAPLTLAKPATAVSPPAQTGSQPTLRDWIGVLAMAVGLFMAIMDVQIVTSSLTQIQGGLSASADEISWVQTAYLIADVVMVPLTGTLSRLLSTRILFVSATLGFTAASALCATATSLEQMIVYRASFRWCTPASADRR